MRIRVTEEMNTELRDIVARRDMAAADVSDVFRRALRKWWRLDETSKENVAFYVAHVATRDRATLDMALHLSVPEQLAGHLTDAQIRDVVRWYIDEQMSRVSTTPYTPPKEQYIEEIAE